MTALHRHIAMALCLCLILTGQTMAAARGAPGPAGQMVICAGGGPVTVFVDENGAPTGPPHICPDCLAAALAAVLPALPAPALPPRVADRARPDGTALALPACWCEPRARAPPAAPV